jgi:predicted adenine nucleotide alpha hydrolase (AANH) superfamily ATPase
MMYKYNSNVTLQDREFALRRVENIRTVRAMNVNVKYQNKFECLVRADKWLTAGYSERKINYYFFYTFDG